ncbi:MAG TPA: isoprenylcysteine carboxylmethyltransferase family protein [Actinoplanes sp.]|nr:isoprenylcysteine carboxylmethyltransferase family protein [Actinoplanes sp.]
MIAAAGALALNLTALALAFGWRSLAQWRATGDTGLRLDAGPPGTLRWWAKLLFVAALALGVAGPAAGVAGLPPIGALDHRWLQITGLGIAVLGIAAVLAAQLDMGASWRIGVDPSEHTTLVTCGTFAVSRNPIFTAMAFTSTGLTLLAPNPLAVLATATLIAALQLQVRRVEEPYLIHTHGTAYTTYASRAGRFLPGVGRLRNQ